MQRSIREDYLVTLLVPVYNEEATIEIFMDTIESKLESLLPHLEVVFVDDGSRDKSAQIIEKMIEQGRRLPVSLLRLSRNFGKEAAMTAALDVIDSDAVIPMDVDLQDPPELIPEFIKVWLEEGVDNVYGVRVDRSQDTEVKRVTSGGFYYVFNKLSSKIKIPANAGDFRLMDRKVIDTVRMLHENNRFMKGLFAWPGFTGKGVPYQRPQRVAGTSKWNYWKLWNFALDGIVSFSSLPLRVWSYIGAGIGLLSLVYMLYIVFETLITGIDVPGYASIMCVVLFLGAVQLISIGVLGEYLGRMSAEVKRRPVFVISEVKGALQGKLPQGANRTLNGMFFNEYECEVEEQEPEAEHSAQAEEPAEFAEPIKDGPDSENVDKAAAPEPAEVPAQPVPEPKAEAKTAAAAGKKAPARRARSTKAVSSKSKSSQGDK